MPDAGNAVVRALTVRQPWASLIALGTKRIETRSWRTRYRGPVAIHAGTRHYNDGWDLRLLGATVDLCGGLEHYPAALPRGAIIGVANLTGCALMGGPYSFRTGTFEGDAGDLPDEDVLVIHSPLGWPVEDDQDPSLVLDRAHGPTEVVTDQFPFGFFEAGRYGWLLEDARELEPVACRGKLGLWTVPDDVAELVERQLVA